MLVWYALVDDAPVMYRYIANLTGGIGQWRTALYMEVYLLGPESESDPRYPWTGEILRGAGDSGPADKAKRGLGRSSEEVVERALETIAREEPVVSEEGKRTPAAGGRRRSHVLREASPHARARLALQGSTPRGPQVLSGGIWNCIGSWRRKPSGTNSLNAGAH